MDWQILAFQDAATLDSFDFVSGREGERVLDIRGSLFKDVVDVRINGVSSPEFIVASKHRILAQLPERSLPLTEVVVLTGQGGLTHKSIVSFEAFVGGRVASGRTAMVQRYLKMLMTSPRRDIFRPGDGGGLLLLVGSAMEAGELRARASMAVEKTTQLLTQRQSQDRALPPSETLRSVTVTNLSVDHASATLFLGLSLTAADGTTSYSSLSL